jgi:hypothetical protein
MHAGVFFKRIELLLGFVQVLKLSGVCDKAVDNISLVSMKIRVILSWKTYMVQSLVSPKAPSNRGSGLVPASIPRVPVRSASVVVVNTLSGGVRTLSMMLITPPVNRMF